MITFPDWANADSLMSDVALSEQKIRMVQFCQQGFGTVQEEIRMAVAPETIVARLFTPNFQFHKVFMITGAEIF